MKSINRLLALTLLASFAAFFQSCSKEPFQEMTEIPLTRCLQPTELKASVSSVTGNTVTIKWNTSTSAEKYTVVIASDKQFATIVHQGTVPTEAVPYTVLLDPDCSYYLKIQATSSKLNPSNWAYYADDSGELKSIKTFAVKDPLYPQVIARTAESISLGWSTEIEDYKEVTHIEYCKTGGVETGTYQLTEADIKSGTATVPGLEPSMEYDLKLMYLSASRGELVIWTTPDVSGTTEVSTLAGLQNAIKTSGAKILLKKDGSPYLLAACDISNGFSIYGEETADGTKPVIMGEFHFADNFAAGESLYFEGVEFNGNNSEFGFAIQKKNGGSAASVKIGNITYKNCNITGYSKGLIYEWGKTMEIVELTWRDCLINNINKDGTQGGDVIDIRNATKIEKLNILNNTIYQGMRTFVRFDTSDQIGDIRFENNTLQNLCFVDNTNNAGIFGFQKAPASISMKKNLFLNFTEKSVLGSENAKYLTAEGIGLAASDNWFYNVHDAFFTASYPASKAGYNALEDDPCFNAKGGVFNILASSEIYGREIGASRWWAAYSKEPENLTQNVLESAKTWDLTDAKLFSGTAKEPMVRGELMIVASQDLPIGLDGAITFSAAAAVTKKGVPQDGYLRFKVDGPGSVVLKPVGDNTSAHFTVATCPVVDGTDKPKSASVKGGASPMSCTNGTQKIVISDIVEPTTVLIYPSGPLALEKIAWSEDVSAVNTALKAPAGLKVSPESQKSGEGKDVTVTWDAVANAAGYSVVFKGKTYEVEEGALQFVVEGKTTKMLDAGAYDVHVYALPSADDIYNTMSEAGTTSFAVVPDGGGGETETIVTTVDELKAALGAGKTEITLAAATFDLTADAEYSGVLPVTTPLALKGKEGAIVKGALSVAGEVGDITLDNIDFQAGGQGCFITLLDDPAVKAGTITVHHCLLDGYSKSAVYGNFASSAVEKIFFSCNDVVNHGAGQGVFDFRKGTYGQVVIFGNTIAGGRDFIRMDAACVCSKVDISNNTFDGVALGAGNGFLYVRSTPQAYIVNRNIFLNEVKADANTLLSKTSGVTVPTNMSFNFYYNIDNTNFFSGMINQETATFKGSVLESSPVKDLAAKDYTVTNGVVIACKAGAPKWQPSVVICNEEKVTVKNAEEFTAALDAGIVEITLAAEGSPYTFGEANSFEVPANLHLVGEAGKEVEFHGFFTMSGADPLGEIVMENIKFCGDGTAGNLLTISGTPSAKTIKFVSCTADGFTKSVYYGGTAATVNALMFRDIIVSNHGTGQGVFDIRKGVYETVIIENSTLVGGRDLIRADAGTITNCFKFFNNTVDGSNLGVNGNAIMYVRATPSVFAFYNNLFLNEIADGKTVLLSKTSGVSVPTYAKNNYVYNYDETNFFSGLWTKETAGMASLSYSPVKDAANGNYTLTDALCLSSNVGALRWNPNRGRISSEITVTTLEEFYNALGAGKTSISVKADTIDFTKAPGEEAAFASGVLSLSSSVSLKGVKTFGKQPVIKGGFKLLTGVQSFALQGINFFGNGEIGTLVEVAGALEASKIQLRGCEVSKYSKSVLYGNIEGTVGNANLNGLLVHDMGTGQGTIDIRKKVYGSIVVENSTFYNGCRDFIRADASVAGSLCIRNNTFSAVSVDAANSILYVRCDVGEQYVVENNLFLNETGTTTILAKTGTKVPVMKNNHFFNCSSAAFWNGTIDQTTATGNGGSALDTDPCTDSANGKFKLVNQSLKTLGVGDPRWR